MASHLEFDKAGQSRAADRRAFPRYRAHLPADMRLVGSSTVFHISTTDVSLGGCYIAMMFTLQVGTEMELALQVGSSQVFCHARVVTCDPQVGNGIAFEDMLQADREQLQQFLETLTPGSAAIPERHEPELFMLTT